MPDLSFFRKCRAIAYSVLTALLFAAAPVLHAASGVKHVLPVEPYSSPDSWTEHSALVFREFPDRAGCEIFQFGVVCRPGMVQDRDDIEELQAGPDFRNCGLIVVYDHDAANLSLAGRSRPPRREEVAVLAEDRPEVHVFPAGRRYADESERVRAILRKPGVDSARAGFRARALEIFGKKHDFNFILTNLRMPKVDGAQLVGAARAMPES